MGANAVLVGDGVDGGCGGEAGGCVDDMYRGFAVWWWPAKPALLATTVHGLCSVEQDHDIGDDDDDNEAEGEAESLVAR